MNKNMYKVKIFWDSSFTGIEKQVNNWLVDKTCEVINTSFTSQKIPGAGDQHYAMVTYKISYDCKCAQDL